MKQKIKQQVEEKRGEIESAIVKPIFRTSTNYKKFPKKIKELDKTRITESAGYQTIQQKVDMLLAAGERLDTYRRSNYDFPEGEEINTNYSDPTRERGFDHLDAHQLHFENHENLTQQKLKYEQELKEADKKEKAEIKEKLKRLEEYEKNNPDLKNTQKELKQDVEKTSET